MTPILFICILILSANSFPLAEYYCGFGTSFCGQSLTDDTNGNASLIILAFANIQSNGSVLMDTANYPCALVTKWQSEGKKVFLSIGGAVASWAPLFSNPNTAIASITTIMQQTTLDGIDLDIQEFSTPPQSVASFIISLKTALRGKFLSVCMQNVNVYQGEAVPSPTTGNQYWNYMVPIWQIAGQSIDMVSVQAYNNWYDGLTEGTLSYLQDTYLNWINAPSPFCAGCSPIANFSGIPQNKLLLGVPASAKAGSSPPNGTIIDQFRAWMVQNNYAMLGAFIWDSSWDASNQYQMSNWILTSSSSSPVTPSTPKVPSICNNTVSVPRSPLPMRQKMMLIN